MAFSLADLPTKYDWTATIRIPVDDGYKKVKSKVTFKYVDDARYDELRESEDGIKALLREVLVDWDFTDENGDKLEDIDRVLSVSFISLCLAEAYTKSRMGVEEKN